jgi:hypothetical protein
MLMFLVSNKFNKLFALFVIAKYFIVKDQGCLRDKDSNKF